MGLEEGVIRPASYEQVRAEADGFVLLLAKEGQMLRKGEQWATLDPEQLELDRRTFELEKCKQDQQIKKGREDLQDARLRTSLELQDYEGKRDELAGASKDERLPVDLRKRAREALMKLDERIGLLNEKLSPVNVDLDLKLLEEDADLQIARKQKQLLALEKRSCLIAGFSGELRLSDPVREQLASAPPGGLLWLKANDLLGIVVNDKRFEISVAASGPLLAEIPREDLLVFLQDAQTGGLIAGDFTRTDEVDNGREITRTYVFSVREEDSEHARRSLGTRSMVHVYRKFSRPYRLVYKKDIAFLEPDVLESSGWDGLVRHLWQGSSVIQVGPQTIAVKPKDED